MSESKLPKEVADAVRAWGEAMIAGPEKCTCKGHPGWNGEEEHSDNCQWIRAGVIEHYAGNAARRAIRAWAVACVAKASSSPGRVRAS